MDHPSTNLRDIVIAADSDEDSAAIASKIELLIKEESDRAFHVSHDFMILDNRKSFGTTLVLVILSRNDFLMDALKLHLIVEGFRGNHLAIFDDQHLEKSDYVELLRLIHLVSVRHTELNTANIIKEALQVGGGDIDRIFPRIRLTINGGTLNSVINKLIVRSRADSTTTACGNLLKCPSLHTFFLWLKEHYWATLERIDTSTDNPEISLKVSSRTELIHLRNDSANGTISSRLEIALLEIYSEVSHKTCDLTISMNTGDHEKALKKLDAYMLVGGNPSDTDPDSSSGSDLNLNTTAQIRHKTDSLEASAAVQNSPGAYVDPQQISVLKSVIFTVIAKKEYSCYDFEARLEKLIVSNIKPHAVFDDGGMSLLHQIVLHVRPSYLGLLFTKGCWAELVHLQVGEHNLEWGGMTVKDICVKRSRSRKMLKDILYYSVWEKSLSGIHIAARKGKGKKVQELLTISDLETPDHAGATVLYWAIVGNNLPLVKHLIRKKANLNVTTDRGETLLHLCATLGRSEMVQVLLEKQNDLDPNKFDNQEKSAWERNGERGDIQTLKVLLEYGKKLNDHVLLSAAHNGRAEYVKHVVDKVSPSIDVDFADKCGRSGLLKAAENGHFEVIKLLIRKGACVTHTDRRGRNIVHILAEMGHSSSFRFAIEQAREQNCLQDLINAQDRYVRGELCFLIRGKNKVRQAWHYVEVKRRLADVFLKKTKTGSVDVAMYGKVIKSGWGPDPEREITDLIDMRFEDRRNTGSTETDQTPLRLAIFKGQTAIAKCLIDAGADVEVVDSFGLRPIHIACVRGNNDIMEALEKRGVSERVEDDDGKCPIDIAKDNEHLSIVRFLEGKTYFARAERFLELDLREKRELFSAETLGRIRNEGGDIKSHLISALGVSAIHHFTSDSEESTESDFYRTPDAPHHTKLKCLHV